MERKFNFVYLTTNLINGKQYVGDHSTLNINDGYIGSGQLISKAIKKYNKENFKHEILEFFDTKQQAFDAQEKYINEYNTIQPNGYNISPKGGHNVKGCFSENSKLKISNSLKETYKNNPNLIENIRTKHEGLFPSIESREKMKNSALNRTSWKISDEGIKNIKESASKPKSEEHKKHLSESKKGSKMSKETKEKISNSLKGRKPKYSFPKGEKNPNGKLNENDINKIKIQLADKEKVSKIANEFNVSLATIYNIKRGKR